MSVLVFLFVYFAYFAFVKNMPMAGYDDATDFLFYWYSLWGTIAMLFMLVFALVATFGAGVKASEGARTGAGKLLAFMVGGTFGAGAGLLGMVLVALHLSLSIGGAWLLSHADDHATSLETLDKTKLIVGGLMVFLSLFVSRTSKSKKNDD